LLSPP
ncbi:membrane-fusion domain protein, partial [Vibrio parahaemolyticus EKP-021]